MCESRCATDGKLLFCSLALCDEHGVQSRIPKTRLQLVEVEERDNIANLIVHDQIASL